MAKRKTTKELIAELRLFNHHESAAKMESLDAQVRAHAEALSQAADLNDELKRRLAAYGDDGKPVFADRSVPADGSTAPAR